MFCGDETGGVVIDVGAANTRFGYAGDDMPKSVFSSMVGVVDDLIADGVGSSSSFHNGAKTGRRYLLDQAMRIPQSDMEVKAPIDLGMVEDFDVLEAVWRHGYSSISANASEHPAIMAEALLVLPQQREKIAEIMFESIGAPALYLAKSAVLQAFAAGRASALVVDIGASGSRVTPVWDGHVLHKGAIANEVGGQCVTAAVNDYLAHSGQLSDGTIWPRSLLKKTIKGSNKQADGAANNVRMSDGQQQQSSDGGGGSRAGASSSSSSSAAANRPSSSSSSGGGQGAQATGRYQWEAHPRTDVECSLSYRACMSAEVADDIKKSVCEVAEVGFDPSKPPPKATYELPDGTIIRIGEERQSIPELHFRVDTMAAYQSVIAQRVTTAWHSQFVMGGMTRLPAPIMSALNPAETLQGVTQLPYTLPHMVYHAISCSHAEFRKDLCNGVLLTGGGSLLRGLPDRLKWETIAVVPAAFKPRLLVPAPLERSFGGWIGGSILASLGTFQQMWVSRAEYDEEGSGVLDRKCVA